MAFHYANDYIHVSVTKMMKKTTTTTTATKNWLIKNCKLDIIKKGDYRIGAIRQMKIIFHT